MTANWTAIASLLHSARASGRMVLLETEGARLLDALAIRSPAHLFVKDSREAITADTSPLDGDLAVVKVVSPEILHKSDVGGVAVVRRHPAAIAAAIEDMEERLGDREVAGFLISQFVKYDASLGNELLLGLRWTSDFGPVVTFGAGGIYTEFLARHFAPGHDVAIVPPDASPETVDAAIRKVAVTRLVAGGLRGQKPRIRVEAITEALGRFAALAWRFVPAEITECEINPLVVTPDGLVALDILVKLGDGMDVPLPRRPLWKLQRLLEPRSAAIIGVSEKLNPGHIILNNLIREGFDRSRLYVVKPGSETIESCRCYPDVASLPEKVDLFILAINAAQAPETVAEIVEREKAESLIVIPGGLEEKQGTEELTSRMRAALRASRESAWEGPLINGGNCLGIRSLPGRYDTMFIPEYKLPVPTGEVSPLAIVSQSGAFAVARMSRLGRLNPKYSISVGNQMDLTVGDYLEYLKDDRELKLFAVYVEGFAPLDGAKFLKAAREIVASGRTVIFYRAGRTAAGARASASHTAAIAGDYAVTRELARGAGVVLAESLADFDDLTRLFALLRGKRVGGRRLGAVSNAGFECVAIADNLGRFELSSFGVATTARLQAIFQKARIDTVVDVHNPIDLTPMTSDAPYEEVVRAVLDDPDVDVGIVGCVPMTPALNSVPPGAGHRDDVRRADGIGPRLVRLKQELPKAWVAVVDAGALYDPLAAILEEGGVPTFRTADRALRLLNVFCAARAGKAAFT